MKILNERLLKKTVVSCLIFVLMVSNIQVTHASAQTEAEKLNSLGLLLNISEDELSATLTRDIGLTMILKALGYTQEDAEAYVSVSPFTDTEKWSKGWVSLAYALEITTGTTGTTFSPDKTLSEHEFLTFLLRALGYEKSESYTKALYLSRYNGLIDFDELISDGNYIKSEAAKAMYNALSAVQMDKDEILADVLIEKGLFTLAQAESVGLFDVEVKVNAVTVINPYTIEVKFNQRVDSGRYFFNIENDRTDYRVYDYWDDTESIATIVTPSNLAAGEYTLITQQYTTSSKTEYENVFVVKDYSKLTPVIYSDSVELGLDEMVQFGLLNGYDEAELGLSLQMTVKAESMLTGAALEISLKDDDTGYYGEFSDLDGEGLKIGDSILVTISYEGNSVTKEIKVVEDESIISLMLISPMNNTVRIEKGNRNISLSYNAMTKSGVSKKLPRHATNQDGVTNQETIGAFIIESSNPALLSVDNMKVDGSGDLKFSLENTPGITTLSIYDIEAETSQYISLAIYQPPVLSEIEIADQLLLIAVGETIDLDVAGFDQFGNEYDFTYISGLDVNSTDEDVIDDKDVNLMDNILTIKGSEEGDAHITIFNGQDDLLFSYRFDVEEEAEPHRIVEVNMPTLFEAAENAVYELSYDDFYIEDQYSREYDMTDKKETILMTLDEDEDEILDIGDGEISGGDLEIAGVYRSDDEDDDEEEIVSSTYIFEIEDVDTSEFLIDISTVLDDVVESYQLDDIEELEVGLSNEVALQLYGYNSDDEAIVIDESKISFVTSSDENLVSVNFEGTEITVLGEDGGTGGVVTVTVWSDGEEIATSTVTVLEDPDNDEDDE